MRTGAALLTLRNLRKPPGRASRKPVPSMRKRTPTATVWSPSRNSSLHRPRRRRPRFPNPSPRFAVRSLNAPHRLSPKLSRLNHHLNLNPGSNSPLSKVGHNSVLNSKAGSNRLHSRGGLVLKRRWSNRPFARACTAAVAALDWTLTGVSARCAVSKTWATDAASMGDERPVFEEHCFVKPHAGGPHNTRHLDTDGS